MSTPTSCPTCGAVASGPVPASGVRSCTACGHRWGKPSESDEYMPVEGGGSRPDALTGRHSPSRPVPAITSTPGNLPFDQLEEESRRLVAQRPVSEMAFRPSTDNISDGRIGCPVCGHAFVARPGEDEQRCPQCSTSFSHSTGRLVAGGAGGSDRLIGRVLRGCMIDRKLGEGGMGAVYHARQLSLDRSVAIKVLPPELARNRNFIQRFEREAKSLARINHANILQIYDFGDDQALGVYFMVIEYVDGWDLGELMRRQPTLSQIETLDILRQALLGLEQAAEKGVIHRDIKPDNLMVGLNGLCKVSDFGLAKGSSSDSEVTSVGVRVGTPAFMSPEQCDGVEVDSRSDVYNLGCTAFLMLTGHLPYDGETPFSIMLKHKVDPVPSLRSIRADVDPKVDALIRRMMAKRPDDRCYGLRELIDEAEDLLIQLTGTASVLRKTNGPIRALVQHATDHGSSGKRKQAAAEVEVDLPADSPPPVRNEPLPGARPSGRQRTLPAPVPTAPAPRAGEPAAIPEWLRPVDAEVRSPSPPPAPTAPTRPNGGTTGPMPAIGSRTGPAPAVGSRTAQAAALGHAPSGVSRLQPPPTLATPFPGNITPLPGERRAGTTSSTLMPGGALDRARERGIKAEVAAIAAGAERMAASGSWEQAAGEWRRAAQLARDTGESRRLADLSRDAAQRAKRRRRWRGLVIGAASALLLGVNLWIWPPVVHNLIAERERARLEAVADPQARARGLREFAAANQGGWRWYRTLFGRGYEVPAAISAAQAAETPPPVVPPGAAPKRSDPAPLPASSDALAGFQRLVADPDVALPRLLDQGRPLTAHPEVAAALRDAEARLAQARALLQRSLAAQSQGRHGEALDLAAQLIAEQPRAGALLAERPLPGRVRALDADSGGEIAGMRLLVNGVELPAGEARFCRAASADTQIEVSATGYAVQRVAVVAGSDAAERVVEVRLGPAPLWRVVAPNQRPAWLRLHAAGAVVISHSGEAVVAIDAATGSARPLTQPGVQVMPWWAPGDSNWAFATADGEQRQILPTLDRSVPVRRLGGPPIAMLDIDLVYRAGGRLALAIEPAADGLVLIARDGTREAWRVAGLRGPAEPLLRRVDDRIVVVDNQSVLVVEEDGTVASRLPLRAPRSGAAAELPGGRLLIPTSGGIDLLLLTGGVRLTAHPWLSEAGVAVPAAEGTAIVLARSDRAVDIATWADEPVRPRWRAKIAGRPAQVALSGGFAAVADEAGAVTVLRLSDGVTVRRIAHGVALATPPLLLPGLVVLGDQTGALAGYRLPQ